MKYKIQKSKKSKKNERFYAQEDMLFEIYEHILHKRFHNKNLTKNKINIQRQHM